MVVSNISSCLADGTIDICNDLFTAQYFLGPLVFPNG